MQTNKEQRLKKRTCPMKQTNKQTKATKQTRKKEVNKQIKKERNKV